MRYTGLGIHVFAGGFSQGVQNVANVETHLETHGFGIETAAHINKVEVINCDANDWPYRRADFVFGNPRCTAFSTVTAGYSEKGHGPWAAQTIDLIQLCEYSVKHNYPIICWESVQGAFGKAGRPLIKKMVDEVFKPNGYRVAHLLMSACAFGNPQRRMRYFFVGYKGDKPFNVSAPRIPTYISSVRDMIEDLEGRPTQDFKLHHDDYGPDSYQRLDPKITSILEHFECGWDLHMIAKYKYHLLQEPYTWKWTHRTSEMPFSLHCPYRLAYDCPCPTLTGTCGRLIHPTQHRPLTVLELSRLMGWGDNIPKGKNPFGELGKGVVPAVGEWLAQQFVTYLDDGWGGDDYESSYDPKLGRWEGRDTHGELEKTINLSAYRPYKTESQVEWESSLS